MGKEIRQYVRYCQECQRTKEPTQWLQELLNPLPIPDRLWQSLGMDFLGPLL